MGGSGVRNWVESFQCIDDINKFSPRSKPDGGEFAKSNRKHVFALLDTLIKQTKLKEIL